MPAAARAGQLHFALSMLKEFLIPPEIISGLSFNPPSNHSQLLHLASHRPFHPPPKPQSRHGKNEYLFYNYVHFGVLIVNEIS